jgi:hypothetical protein
VPLALCLAACKPQTSVDLTVVPPEGVTAVNVRINSVQIESEDGDLTTLSTGLSDRVNLLDFKGGDTLQLVSDAKLDEDTYTGIRLGLDTEDAELVLADGRVVPIDINTASAFADIDIALAEGNESALLIELNLPFSLINRMDSQADYRLTPAWRAADEDKVGTIKGEVSADLIGEDFCRNDAAIGESIQGVAVYLFDKDASPVDFSPYYANGPLTSANVQFYVEDGSYAFQLNFVPEGDYVLALTCEADQDLPQSYQGLSFPRFSEVTVIVDEIATVEFE